MISFQIRFNTWHALIGVALIALNLSMGLKAYRHYPRQKISPGAGLIESSAHRTYVDGVDGSFLIYDQIARPGEPPKVVQPPRLTLLDIWSPVLGSGAITLLAIIAMRNGAWRRWPRLRISARGLLIMVALIGLNFAGAMAAWSYYPRPLYVPIPVHTGEDWGSINIIGFDKNDDLVIRDRSIPGHTLVIKSDGSQTLYQYEIVFHKIPLNAAERASYKPPKPNPRPLESYPHRVIRPPRPTLLRIWSPVLACAAITLLVLVAMARRAARRPRTGIEKA
jgi:hypothetical protein